MGGRRDGSNSSDANIEPLEYTMVSWGDSPCLEEGQLVSVNWYTSNSEYRMASAYLMSREKLVPYHGRK